MTAVATKERAPADTFVPQILVFSTNNISDPGIDLAGSSHMHYSPGVKVIGLPVHERHPPVLDPPRHRGRLRRRVRRLRRRRVRLPPRLRQALVGDHGQRPGHPARAGHRPPAPAHGGDLLGLLRAIHEARPGVLGGARRARPLGDEVNAMTAELTMLAPVPDEPRPTDYDVLVVGSGIGGMESALKLGDMGYKVLLVEKEASVGGKMILLSKVFPTLDCASCISTPKMAATIHHPNITAMTYSQVDGISRGPDGLFNASVTRKARFVDESTCTGCHCARPPAPWPCPTSSTPTSWRAERPTSPSRRPCRRRPSSTEPAARRARSRARPASRPTATSRSSAAASTRRPIASCSTRRRSSAPSDAPATRRARASAPADRSRARSRSGA